MDKKVSLLVPDRVDQLPTPSVNIHDGIIMYSADLPDGSSLRLLVNGRIRTAQFSYGQAWFRLGAPLGSHYVIRPLRLIVAEVANA
ncbi:hypothetical protein [Spirosoma sordidisoli]|uniref:Uncharacterized protein n=1 Tax=Spirosoma sordidisoli TaxID=2502893 RepID=A0A4Q2UGG1_9BACT|nr:hypothetical protein [Spirosoma sordidisoli]RYC66350.1 hypothetical protein EQG79_30215 [Spirosoma sordidisoli]